MAHSKSCPTNCPLLKGAASHKSTFPLQGLPISKNHMVNKGATKAPLPHLSSNNSERPFQTRDRPGYRLGASVATSLQFNFSLCSILFSLSLIHIVPKNTTSGIPACESPSQSLLPWELNLRPWCRSQKVISKMGFIN